MDSKAILEIADRIEEACSREGKPSGYHMIDGQRAIVKCFRSQYCEDGDENLRDIADVADCMAHCIENEALLFECLKTEAMKAVVILRSVVGGTDE